MLRVLSLFAGVGGFDLGLERTGGFKTVAFCEIDKKAQTVLRKHWPEVPIYDDVRTLTKERLAADGITVDVVCGGFPCQDISYAGRGAGLAGERSGLFYEVARILGELEPGWVLLENVSALLTRGLGDVLGTLASLGYDAQWHCIPAAAVGAPHRRDRIWILAHAQRQPDLQRHSGAAIGGRSLEAEQAGLGSRDVADAERQDAGRRRVSGPGEDQGSLGKGSAEEPFGSRETVPHAHFARLEGWLRAEVPGGRAAIRHAGTGGWWSAEPAVGRVAHGVPGRVDRLKQLGNAVVPQLPELIGRAILASLAERKEAA